jgi:ribonuclease VapC
VSGLVVDTSALIAILRRDPGHEWLGCELAGATTRVLAAPMALELGIVLESRTPGAVGIGARLLRDADIEVVAFDEDLASRAVDAWRRFGKGRHPAQLNFGDCCTYALAERSGHLILCVGDDFARTDLPVRRPPG